MQTSPQVTEVELSPELLAELDAIPDRFSTPRVTWTEREIKLLLAGWGVKTQLDISKLIGHCVSACKAKYKELTEGA